MPASEADLVIRSTWSAYILLGSFLRFKARQVSSARSNASVSISRRRARLVKLATKNVIGGLHPTGTVRHARVTQAHLDA